MNDYYSKMKNTLKSVNHIITWKLFNKSLTRERTEGYILRLGHD